MLKNIVYSFFTKGLVALTNFLILIVSSRYLGVSSRGEISIFILNIAVVQILNEIYTGYSIIHFLPRFDLRKIIMHGLVYSVLFCILGNAILQMLNKLVPGYEWHAYILSVLVILNTFFCVIILGKESVKAYSLLSLLQPFLLFCSLCFCIFFLRIFTLHAYLFALYLSFATALLFSSVLVAKYFLSSTGKKEFSFKAIIGMGFIFQASSLLFIFMNRYSYYLLNDRAAVGLYATACSLMEAVLIISNGVAPVLLARLANEKPGAVPLGLTVILAKICFLLSLLAVIVLGFLPDKLFTMVIGNGFAGIKNMMLLYAPATLMQSVLILFSSYFTAGGKQRFLLFAYGSGGLSALIIAPHLLAVHGVSGAAYTANIAYGIATLLIFYFMFRKENLLLTDIFSLRKDAAYIRKLRFPSGE